MGTAAYLFSRLEDIKKTLRRKFVRIFLDFDGTLAPIEKTPDKAVMPEETRGLLRQLAKMPNCKIAIVSGRALKDISKRIGLEDIVYVGNHGFEIKGPKIDFKIPVSYRYRKTLENIKDRLVEGLSPVNGVIIEDKGFSLSVHYRLADKKDIARIKNEFHSILLFYEVHGDVKVKTGKLVLEVMPPVEWDKGKAVLWLLARRKFVLRAKKIKVLPVYVGDDATDEDAFGALKDRGMTVFVGKSKRTKARFYVKGPFETAVLLKLILETLSDKDSERRYKK